jgi:hypothetical protein
VEVAVAVAVDMEAAEVAVAVDVEVAVDAAAAEAAVDAAAAEAVEAAAGCFLLSVRRLYHLCRSLLMLCGNQTLVNLIISSRPKLSHGFRRVYGSIVIRREKKMRLSS